MNHADVPILMYHSIGIGSAPLFRKFVVSPDDFAEQMSYLDANGYTPITAVEMAERRPSGSSLPPHPIVLTFDDAYTDFYTTALPVLKKYGFPATIYVPTAYVGGAARWLKSSGEESRELLSWQALRDITAEHIEVAAHSHSHFQLDRVSNAVIRDEVYRPRCLLEDKLGIPVRGFAYPFGYWNKAVRAAIATADYRYACAVSELIATPADNLFTLPRLSVDADTGITGLTKLLGSTSTPSRRSWAKAKRIVWRAARAGTHEL